MIVIARPTAQDHLDYHAAYVARVPDGDFATLLEAQGSDLERDLSDFAEPAAEQPYAQGKWSVKQVVGHLADAERVMAYRLLRIARGDATPLQGFDQDAYVEAGAFNARSLGDLVAEFQTQRRATVALLKGLSPETFSRRGIIKGHPMSAGALLYVIYGHVAAHIEGLREHYGVGR
ncbi:MAG: DinB family protein [Firmicutes bacterium]|nr:DinB family protein [Bacillota bacterium]